MTRIKAALNETGGAEIRALSERKSVRCWTPSGRSAANFALTANQVLDRSLKPTFHPDYTPTDPVETRTLFRGRPDVVGARAGGLLGEHSPCRPHASD